ncbi:hypothetical protein QQX98_002880 [Neonectria punicea]|uniref:CENP-V/GFA domain-containing protein n=1 Tax=Neonectria punicea TaxID=979145 RepID=A0ABR1HGC6_9HYPO
MDGGLSVWMPHLDDHFEEQKAKTHALQSNKLTNESLDASCACGNVRFHITRPNEDSRGPRRNFPDLMFPDKTTEEHVKQNSADDKWWIPNNGSKYLAGTCACRSCRFISGFEVQTWAFVPRNNIFFHVPGTNNTEAVVPLDFETLPAGILKSYSSSPNVLREFCGTCGATVFWHEKSRSDVIDVSIGLLRAPDGARAESWLEWWLERVSFAEEAGTGRVGSEAKVASELIDASASTEKKFMEDDSIKTNYYPEVERLLLDHIPGANRVFIFDHTVRCADPNARRSPVQKAHVDQTAASVEQRIRLYFPNEADALLKQRYRLINVWRPLNERPVESFPLVFA